MEMQAASFINVFAFGKTKIRSLTMLNIRENAQQIKLYFSATRGHHVSASPISPFPN